MLQIRSVGKSYPTRSGGIDVLRGVELTLNAGESLAVMGPSGSGKSTLLNIIGTLEPPTTGTVMIGSSDPFALPADQLARFRSEQIGFIFQEHHLLPQCSALENVLLPTLATSAKGDRSARARELLQRVGLNDRLEHRPAELSGGERQRVAMARALINEPAVILADEPTGNLDEATAERVVDLLLELHRGAQRVLITVTHSEAVASRFDRRVVLRDGALQEAPGG